MRRAAPARLGDLGPDCPAPLRSIALDIASTACSCYLGPVVTPTASAATTKTTVSTVTQVVTSTVVVPAITETLTNTGTATSEGPRTATVTTKAPVYTVTGAGYCQCKYQVNEDSECPGFVDDGDYTLGSLKACIDQCDANPGCEGINYVAASGACNLWELAFDVNYKAGSQCAYRRSCVNACRL